MRTRGRPGFEDGAIEVDEDRGALRVTTDRGTVSLAKGLKAYVTELAFASHRTAIFMDDRADFGVLYDHLQDLGWVRTETRARMRRVPVRGEA